MSARSIASVVSVALVAALSACKDSGGAPAREPPPAPAAPATQVAATTATDTPAMARATQLFKERCSTCHGPAGDGQGPAAAGLTVKPRNYTDRAWQASTTDALIEKVILEGGPSIGKSPLMPPNPDLAGTPDVVAALRTIVRGFGAAEEP